MLSNKRSLASFKKVLPGNMRDNGADIRQRYSTGIPPLDIILTGEVGKGLPSGRVIEVYGNESVGKTTLCLSLISEMQKTYNGVAMLWDTEQTMSTDRAEYLGVDVDSLIYPASSVYCEDIMQQMLMAVNNVVVGSTDPCGVLIWDTVAGTEAKSEHGKKVGESGAFSPHARILSEGFRKLCRPLAKTQFTTVCCNQLKSGGMGKMFAIERDTEATLGGKAMRFHSHIRLRMEMKRKFIMEVDKRKAYIGDEIRVTKVKDKEAASGVSGTDCILVLRKMGEGAGKFSHALSCLRTLQNWGMFAKDAIQIGGKKITPIKFEEMYNADPVFQDTVHKMLVSVRALRLKLSERIEDCVADDDEDELTG